MARQNANEYDGVSCSIRVVTARLDGDELTTPPRSNPCKQLRDWRKTVYTCLPCRKLKIFKTDKEHQKVYPRRAKMTLYRETSTLYLKYDNPPKAK